MRALPSRRRFVLFGLAAAAMHAAAIYACTRVTWNDSPSVPRGLYLRRPGALVTVGSTVLLPVPAAVRALVAERGYLPVENALLKVVAAMPGDRVCLDGAKYEVNGLVVARVLSTDSLGRALPPYRFCGEVPDGEAFVVTQAPRSFDSRYFGPVSLSTLTVVKPLWMSSR